MKKIALLLLLVTLISSCNKETTTTSTTTTNTDLCNLGLLAATWKLDTLRSIIYKNGVLSQDSSDKWDSALSEPNRYTFYCKNSNKFMKITSTVHGYLDSSDDQVTIVNGKIYLCNPNNTIIDTSSYFIIKYLSSLKLQLYVSETTMVNDTSQTNILWYYFIK